MTRKQFLATLACSRSVTAQTGPAGSVWAVHDGEKVEEDDLQNLNKTRNSAWDGRTIKLFAARNEVVAFQVIVEAGGAGIRNLRVSLPDGSRGRLAYAAPGDDPSNSVGRAIPIFAESYMYLPLSGDGPLRNHSARQFQARVAGITNIYPGVQAGVERAGERDIADGSAESLLGRGRDSGVRREWRCVRGSLQIGEGDRFGGARAIGGILCVVY